MSNPIKSAEMAPVLQSMQDYICNHFTDELMDEVSLSLIHISWRQVPSSNNGLGQRAATTGNKVYTQGQIQELLASGSTQRYFDQAAQSPWLYDGSTFISYEDAESMAAKAAYIRQQGLLGVSCWALDQDATGTLVQTLDAGLR